MLGEYAQNVPKYWYILELTQIGKIRPHFGHFSGYVDWIELIPFASVQASPSTSLEYPQHSIWVTLSDSEKYFFVGHIRYPRGNLYTLI